jgi:hypothetical protein
VADRKFKKAARAGGDRPSSGEHRPSWEVLGKARARHLEEERRRERTLKLRFLLPGGGATEDADTPTVR